MISYITASHNPAVLEILASSLVLEDDDELLVVEDPTSIATAYNEATSLARNPVRCFLHHDVEIHGDLRGELLAACTPEVGMVGVVGSRTPVVPWWSGQRCGSVEDTRYSGVLDFGPGGECAYLDGLLLATCHSPTWDETIPGFHFYDTDMCAQMLDRDLTNWCLTGGHELLTHRTNGRGSTRRVPGWSAAEERFRAKWGLDKELG